MYPTERIQAEFLADTARVLARCWVDDYRIPGLTEGHLMLQFLEDPCESLSDETVVLWAWSRAWVRPGLKADSASYMKLCDAFEDLMQITGFDVGSLNARPEVAMSNVNSLFEGLLAAPSPWANNMIAEYPTFKELNTRVHSALTTYF